MYMLILSFSNFITFTVCHCLSVFIIFHVHVKASLYILILAECFTGSWVYYMFSLSNHTFGLDILSTGSRVYYMFSLSNLSLSPEVEVTNEPSTIQL